ncbi:hypothetical protein GOV10_01000 [Candidatus Woesearchaeota archaeon]|nr:hypothetical protein [Candidatus Woesearchaeota archaeon]
MELIEWAKIFLRHQDLLKRTIKNIEEKEDLLLVTKKECVEEWFIRPALNDEGLDPNKRQGIVTLNSRENLEMLVNNWDRYRDYPTLKIVFANPVRNERWILVPAHHHKIADPESARAGFEAMFNSVSSV